MKITQSVKDKVVKDMKKIKEKTPKKKSIQRFFWEIYKCFDDTFDPAEELKQQDTEDLL